MGTKFYCDRCGKDCEYYCAGEMKATINHIAQYKQEYSFCKACAESFNSWLAMEPTSDKKTCNMCGRYAKWAVHDYYNYANISYACEEHLIEQLTERNVVVLCEVIRKEFERIGE